MPCHSLIAGPGIVRALLSGGKTAMRVTAASPLAACLPGDRIRVREAWLAGRIEAGREYATSRRRAEFAVFADGWRRWQDGHGQRGRPPGRQEQRWIAALHLPDWASRLTLVVESVRQEPLQALTDIRAEGLLRFGPFWRWPPPIPGWHRSARHAFAAQWNRTHAAPGERWEDNPPIVLLRFTALAIAPPGR